MAKCNQLTHLLFEGLIVPISNQITGAVKSKLTVNVYIVESQYYFNHKAVYGVGQHSG